MSLSALFLNIVVGATAIGHRACWFSGTLSPDVCCDPNHQGGCWDGFFSYDICCHDPTPDTQERFRIMDEIFGTCFDTIDARQVDLDRTELQCRGEVHELIKDSFWKTLFFNQRLAKVSVGDSVVKHNEMSDAFFLLIAKEPQRFLLDCAQGVAVLILDMLPEISSRLGTREASWWYQLASTEIRKHQEFLGRDCRWIEMVHFHAFDHYPIFVGPREPLQDCPTDVRIYSYDSALLSADSALSCYARNKFWNTEVLFPQWLQSSRCSVKVITEADFVYVPVFWTCLELIHHKTGSSRSRFTEIAQEIVRLIDAHGAWHLPEKHVWLFSSASWPLWTFEPLREFIRKGIILAVEPNPHLQDPWGGSLNALFDLSTATLHIDLLRQHTGIVIPAVVPYELSRRLMHQDEGRRNFFATFHGQHAGSSVPQVAEKYRSFNETVRPRLIKVFANETSTSVGLPTIAYMETMAQAVFCLCPQGISSYTARLFEAFFAGCIPVILSNDYTPPTYGGSVPWQKLSIKWETSDLIGLRDYLRMLLADYKHVVKDMQRQVKRYSCWFDWFVMNRVVGSRDRACSPYAGVLKQLSAVKDGHTSNTETLPKFWWPV